MNNFLKAVHCFYLIKCFSFLILIGFFENLTVFQHFGTSIDSTEGLQFFRQFRLHAGDRDSIPRRGAMCCCTIVRRIG